MWRLRDVVMNRSQKLGLVILLFAFAIYVVIRLL
jgi:flagellar biogenesis protein FliO